MPIPAGSPGDQKGMSREYGRNPRLYSPSLPSRVTPGEQEKALLVGLGAPFLREGDEAGGLFRKRPPRPSKALLSFDGGQRPLFQVVRAGAKPLGWVAKAKVHGS